MKNTIPLFLLIFITQILLGQTNRNFKFKERDIAYTAYSNYKGHLDNLPGMNVAIIMGKPEENTQELFKNDTLNKVEGKSMIDFTWFYYLPFQNLSENQVYDFLKNFIEQNFENDSFDRNRIFLYWPSKNPLSCEKIKELNTIISGICVAEDNTMLQCNENVFPAKSITKIKKRNTLTSLKYEIPTSVDIEKIKESKNALQLSSNWKKLMFIDITYGQQYIDQNHFASFDKESGIDFSKINTFWNITTGYYINNRFGLSANFGLIRQAVEKGIDEISEGADGSITVEGSGKGAGLYRLGIGVRMIVFSKNRFSTYFEALTGSLTAKAGSKSQSATIGGIGNSYGQSNISSQHALFLTCITAMNYRLNKTLFLTTNIQYTFSEFDQPIGSISGFTGFSFNFGIGFSFYVKKQ